MFRAFACLPVKNWMMPFARVFTSFLHGLIMDCLEWSSGSKFLSASGTPWATLYLSCYLLIHLWHRLSSSVSASYRLRSVRRARWLAGNKTGLPFSSFFSESHWIRSLTSHIQFEDVFFANLGKLVHVELVLCRWWIFLGVGLHWFLICSWVHCCFFLRF